MSATADTAQLPLDFVTYSTTRFVAEPFKPGNYTPSGAQPIPDMNKAVPVLGLHWKLLAPEAYDRMRAEIARHMTAEFEAIRRGFAHHPKWLAVVALEERLAGLVAERKAAEDRAKAQSLKVRQAIIAGDRPAENRAAAAVKQAEAEAADSANRYKIVAEQMPTLRNSALAALRSLLEARRVEIEAEAHSEARHLADAVTALVAPLLVKLIVSNTAAGIAGTPAACLAHGGPSDGLVGNACKLPH